MKLLDSNIPISARNSGTGVLTAILAGDAIAVSAITEVEVLGFHAISDMERVEYEAFFAGVLVLEVTDPMIRQAIALRQIRKMSLGDSLITATALVHKLPLVTRNTRDFSWIVGLTLIDPGATP